MTGLNQSQDVLGLGEERKHGLELSLTVESGGCVPGTARPMVLVI